MKRIAIKLWLTLSVFSVISSLWVAYVSAQSPTGDGIKLTISPLPINLSVQPGQTIEHVLEVRNSGSKVEVLEPSLLTFSSDNKLGNPRLDDPTPDDDYLNWISFSPKQLTLEPLEWGKVTMTIRVPDTAAYGYYFAVTWSRAQQPDRPIAATNLVGSVAQLVLLEVPAPGTKRELKVDSFTTDHKWYEFLPVTVSTTLSNSGNIHVVPFGNIFIVDRNGTEVGNIKVNAERGTILPDSSRIFSDVWDKGFPRYSNKIENDKVVLNQNGQPIRELRWEIDHAEWWRFGRYTAKLVMAYNRDGHDIPLLAEASFWIIPWRLILLAIAIPLLPAVAVYLLMRKRHST